MAVGSVSFLARSDGKYVVSSVSRSLVSPHHRIFMWGAFGAVDAAGRPGKAIVLGYMCMHKGGLFNWPVHEKESVVDQGRLQ